MDPDSVRRGRRQAGDQRDREERRQSSQPQRERFQRELPPLPLRCIFNWAMLSVSRASFVFKEALRFITISKLLDRTEMLCTAKGDGNWLLWEIDTTPLLKLLLGGFQTSAIPCTKGEVWRP